MGSMKQDNGTTSYGDFSVGFAENKAMEDVNKRVTKAEPTVVWFADGLRKRRQRANAL